MKLLRAIALLLVAGVCLCAAGYWIGYWWEKPPATSSVLASETSPSANQAAIGEVTELASSADYKLYDVKIGGREQYVFCSSQFRGGMSCVQIEKANGVHHDEK